jgi:ATP-dependent Clp protease ATP-binding subunit ClpA
MDHTAAYQRDVWRDCAWPCETAAMASKKKLTKPSTTDGESESSGGVQLTIRFPPDFVERIDAIVAHAGLGTSRVQAIRWCALRGIEAEEKARGIKR